MARKRGGEAPLSLFAFQDIITGVAGVMLFILMLLVVQLALPKVQRAATKNTATDNLVPAKPVASRQSIERLAAMKEELEQLRLRSKTLRDIAATNPQATLADRHIEQRDLQQQLELTEQGLNTQRSLLESIQSDQVTKQIARQIDQTKDSLQKTRKELSQWSEGDIVAFRPSAEATAMWIADVQEDFLEVFDLSDLRSIEGPRSIQRVEFAATADAEEIASTIVKAIQQNTTERRLILVVRPAIAEKVSALTGALRARNYDIALELLDTPTQIIAPSDDG